MEIIHEGLCWSPLKGAELKEEVVDIDNKKRIDERGSCGTPMLGGIWPQ